VGDARQVAEALADFPEREAQIAWYTHNVAKTNGVTGEFVIDLHPSMDYGSCNLRICPTILSSSRLFFMHRFREVTGYPFRWDINAV
jgi:hypothetical protein